MRVLRTLCAALAVLGGLLFPAGGAATRADAPATAPTGPFSDEIAAFEASDRQNPPPQGAVLFVGSSSIRFWTTVAQDFPTLTVINRGFGGSEIADSVRYADRIILPYRPRLIVFYAGTNDIDAGKSPAQVLADFQALAAKVHGALPRTRLAFISINPAISRWSKEGQMLEANRLIAGFIRSKAGKADHLSYLDTHAALLGPDGHPRAELYRPDGLHLNAQGYVYWVNLLRPQILALAGQK